MSLARDLHNLGIFWFVVCTALVTLNCRSSIELGRNLSAGKDDASSPARDGARAPILNDALFSRDATNVTDGPEPTPCAVTECQGRVYACGDCLDNDNDGLADATDLECLGPCDDTEASLFGGIPGQVGGQCRKDCYFDNNSGTGNDGCEWDYRCDSLSVAPAFPPTGDPTCAYDSTDTRCTALAQQSTQCLDTCGPLTPNGCDCFGCCELPAGSSKFVWIGHLGENGGSCEIDRLDDPEACPPCTPVDSCLNPCEECELCVGKTSTPPACSVDSRDVRAQRCNFDRAPCGEPGLEACRALEYCITGCCVQVPR